MTPLINDTALTPPL